MRALKQIKSFLGYPTGYVYTIDEAAEMRRKYDMLKIRERIIRAMIMTGKTEDDVSELLGIDTSLPAVERIKQWPKPSMELIASLSNFLGVSVPYLLTGETVNEVDRFVAGHGTAPGKLAAIGDIDGSAVVQDVTADSIIVHNFGAGGALTKSEADVIMILRQLPPRRKAKALNMFLDAAGL